VGAGVAGAVGGSVVAGDAVGREADGAGVIGVSGLVTGVVGIGSKGGGVDRVAGVVVVGLVTVEGSIIGSEGVDSGTCVPRLAGAEDDPVTVVEEVVVVEEEGVFAEADELQQKSLVMYSHREEKNSVTRLTKEE
jgi:hypothetical protein